MSDVHVEFHRDGGSGFIESLDPTGVDALVVAGDLGTSADAPEALRRICARYGQTPVLFVAGNHEHYRSNPVAVIKALRKLEGAVDNLHFLDEDVVGVCGVKFAGTTLWFRERPDDFTFRRNMADFMEIRGLTPWVYEKNQKAETFLQNVLAAGQADVVVTHHLPSYRCVARQYRGSQLNRFFVSEVADEIDPTLLPKVWLYGHTHTVGDEVFDGCRFVCNPLGYPSEGGRGFQEQLIIDVPPRG